MKTYEDYLKTKVKYPPDTSCGIPDCNKPGLYEAGDMRCWFPACEEHARMKLLYELDMFPDMIDMNLDMKKDMIEHLEKRLKELKDGEDRTRE